MSGGALHDLLAVQDLDMAGDQLRHRRAHLPERAELTAVEQEAGALRAELDGVDAQRRALGDRQASVEAELAAMEDRAGAVNRRLFGGQVTASRDLQAMSAELEHLKSRASSLEDSVLEIMEEREPLDSRAAELTARLEALATQQGQVQERLDGAAQAVDAELGDVTARRAQAAAVVPDGLMATYERLRSRLGGVGVARLVGSRCDGCHLTLSAAELEQVRHLPEGQVYQCEQCSRILVP